MPQLAAFSPSAAPAAFAPPPFALTRTTAPQASRKAARRRAATSTTAVPSPLMLCDHLISLAQEADRAGYKAMAGQLVALVDRVFDDQCDVLAGR